MREAQSGWRRRDVLAGAAAAGSLATLSACTRPGNSTPEPTRSLTTLAPRTSWAPAPRTVNGLRVLASQRRTTLELHTMGGDRIFWAGVNLGGTTPGHSPGELAISREDYRRWFLQMADLGVRVVRIYTLHPPHMYEELARFNEANPDAPLYLIQGIYFPDESYLTSKDLFAKEPTEAMRAEIADVSAAVHGDLTRQRQPGRAHGTWSTDVSRWLAAWIVGVELDPTAALRSEEKNAARPPHRGRYFSSTPKASPTERWYAARLDELATAEAARGVSAPIAVVNWPTTDPLRHPDEPFPDEDALQVDANHIRPEKAWPAGTFASYHAYPYFPDFQLLQPSYQGKDPYAAYLRDLARHHSAMPVMVSEVGVPSSLGCAHRGSNGRDQGDHREQKAMAVDATLIATTKTAGMAGALLFSWADEWFKFTWNTILRQSVAHSERRAHWHDPLTNEQHFGLLAMDPELAGRRVVYQGPHALQEVALNHDASYVHLDMVFDTPLADQGARPALVVGFDVLGGAGLAPPGAPEAAQVSDVALVLRGGAKDMAATMFVREDVDPLLFEDLAPEDLPKPAEGRWRIQRLLLNHPATVPTTRERRPTEFQDVGRLYRGTWDTEAAEYDSRATWDLDASAQRLRVRIPWTMLLMGDPSSKTAARPGTRREVLPERVDTITARAYGSFGAAEFPIVWDRWDHWPYRERLKTGHDAVRQALVAASS